jgi:hypothetical protein
MEYTRRKGYNGGRGGGGRGTWGEGVTTDEMWEEAKYVGVSVGGNDDG